MKQRRREGGITPLPMYDTSIHAAPDHWGIGWDVLAGAMLVAVPTVLAYAWVVAQ